MPEDGAMFRVSRTPFDRQGVRRHGLFFADLSRLPLLDASRILLAKGVSPETPIATRHAGADFDDRRGAE